MVFGVGRIVIGLFYLPKEIVEVFFLNGVSQIVLLISLLLERVMWECVWIGGC